MSYTVIYRDTDETTLAAHNSIQALDTEGVSLEEILDNCQTLHTNAALYDTQGSYKGFVHEDGTFQRQ